MKMNKEQIWEAWGQTNALYTTWCTIRGQNFYRLFVLYAINAHEPITQKEIANFTGLSKQTVSTVIRSLKKEGYVFLRSGKIDRREKDVFFTESGKKYADQLLSPLHVLEQRVFDMIGAERMKQLVDDITLFNIVFEEEMEKQANEHNRD